MTENRLPQSSKQLAFAALYHRSFRFFFIYTVLAMMVKDGKLEEGRFEQLKAQPLKLDFNKLDEQTGPAPHLAEYIKRWLLDHEARDGVKGLIRYGYEHHPKN